DVADDLRNRDEPRLLQIRVEFCARDQPYRFLRDGRSAFPEALQLLKDNALDVAGPTTGLAHGGCIYVQLNARPAAPFDIGLEAGRDIDDERETASIHGGIDLIQAQRFGR